MLKRLLLLTLLAFIPFAARADTTTSNPNAALSAPSNADGLGPSAVGGASTSESGGSNADGSSLQPAGTNPLQSTAGDSTGLTAPNDSALQAPAASSEQLQVINNDADGAQQSLDGSSSPSPWGWLWFSLLIGITAAIIALVIRRWRRRPHTTSSRHTDSQAPDETSDEHPTEPTSSQRLRITINAPAATVFKFVLDPENTPKWVDVITEETASEHPPKLGTVYKNRDAGGNWAEYEITEFTNREMFVMTRNADNYHVQYTLTAGDEHNCELEYYEWVDEGTLNEPFTHKELEKLKTVMENPEPTL